jgi:hypothetical protein
MEQPKIVTQYVDLINKEINTNGLTLILYGSTVYGVNHSDLDVCFLSERNLSDEEFEKLIKITFDFHVDNNLRIDEDISFNDKLLYSKDFLLDTFENPPFKFENGKYEIAPIVKTKEFLSSIEMRKRLLLNILTVKREVLIGDIEKVDRFSLIAWLIIIKTVMSYAEKEELSISEFIDIIYKDPFRGEEGELYLGYKSNMIEKRVFLFNEIEQKFKYFTENGEMFFNKETKKYGILDGE